MFLVVLYLCLIPFALLIGAIMAPYLINKRIIKKTWNHKKCYVNLLVYFLFLLLGLMCLPLTLTLMIIPGSCIGIYYLIKGR